MKNFIVSLVLVSTSCLLALAACEKDKEKERVPRADDPPAVVHPCTAATQPHDSILLHVRVSAPLYDLDSDALWRETLLEVPQVTQYNKNCLQVFMAQDTTSTWHPIPMGDEQELFYLPGNGRLYIYIYESKFDLLDFDRDIAIRVRYKK